MKSTEPSQFNSSRQKQTSISERIYHRFCRLFQSHQDFCKYIDDCLENLCKGRMLNPLIVIGNPSDILIALDYITFMLEISPDSIYTVQDVLAKGIGWMLNIITSDRFLVITAANADEIHKLPESFFKRCNVFILHGKHDNSSSITLSAPLVSGEMRPAKVIFFDNILNFLWLPNGRKERLEPSKGKVITAMIETLQGSRSYVRKEELVSILYKTITAPYQKMQKQNNRLKVAISTINAASMRLTGDRLIVPNGKNLLKFAQTIGTKTF